RRPGRRQWFGRGASQCLAARHLRGSAGDAHELGDQARARRSDRALPSRLTNVSSRLTNGAGNLQPRVHATQKRFLWGEGFMRLAASVSLTALALAACATTAAPPPPAAVVEVPAAATPAAPALTPEGAREFVAAAEKDLEAVSLIGSRAAWVNATYITDDTDMLNSYFVTLATEKGVKYATEAAKWLQVLGLDPDTARKLNLLRGGL